jgi:hypothetical protein
MFWLALIEGDNLSADGLRAVLPTSLIIEAQSGARVRFGHGSWDAQTQSSKLLHVQALFMALSDLKSASLTLLFSGQTIQSADAAGLVETWQETHEPPVLSIIALVLGEPQVGHMTHGLSSFVDYELSTRFSDPAHSRDAARDLVRLARYVLAHGDMRADQEMIGVNGPLTILEPTDQPPKRGYWFKRIHAQSAH